MIYLIPITHKGKAEKKNFVAGLLPKQMRYQLRYTPTEPTFNQITAVGKDSYSVNSNQYLGRKPTTCQELQILNINASKCLQRGLRGTATPERQWPEGSYPRRYEVTALVEDRERDCLKWRTRG